MTAAAIHICRELGVPVSDAQLSAAAQKYTARVTRMLAPRSDAVHTLGRLKDSGLRIGLVTNCAPPVPEIWPSTLFSELIEAPVFSCKEGLTKPDGHIYSMAAALLNVSTKGCLYVGDGGSQELTGARAAGMHPVLIRIPEVTSRQVV